MISKLLSLQILKGFFNNSSKVIPALLFCIGAAFFFFVADAHAWDLTIIDGGGGGIGSPSPAVGVHTYADGTTVSLIANPDVSSDFQWSGAGLTPAAPALNQDASIFMDSDKTVTINYSLKTVTLTVTVAGGGIGTALPASGSTYTWGDSVSLTASPDVSSDFQWSGANLTPATPALNQNCSVTMNGDQNVTVTFTLKTVTLTVTVAGGGSGTALPASGSTYTWGDSVSLTASPDMSSDFQWSGANLTPATPALNQNCSVTMNGDQNVTVTFTLKTVTLTVTVAGGGSGTALPASGSTYTWGDSVSLTASPDMSSDFQWSGANLTPASPALNQNCSVTMNGDQNVTVTFSLKTVTLTVTVTGTGLGTASPASGSTYTWGASVPLTAVPDVSSDFQWSGANLTPATPAVNQNCSVTMNGDQSVTVNFILVTFTITATANADGTITPGTTVVPRGDSITFTIDADSGYCTGEILIDGVPGGTISTPSNYTFSNVTSDHSIEASFELPPHNITASASGGVTITSPTGTDPVCTGGSKTFIITAPPDSCLQEVLVDGVPVVTGNLPNPYTYTFTNVTTDHTISANARGIYEFTGYIEPLEVRPGGRWSLVDMDKSVTITGWEEHENVEDVPCGSDNFRVDFKDVYGWNTPTPIYLAISGNANATGTYTRKQFDLTMATSPASGGGTTTPAPGVHSFTYEDVVNITAIPEEGWVFIGWTGEVADPGVESTTVTIDASKTVIANFAEDKVYLSMAKSGQGTVSPDVGSHEYLPDDVVTLSAVPDSANGWEFGGWSGGVADPASPTTTITMDGNKNVTAFFTLNTDPDDDFDGDGYTENEGDCNDTNASIHPGASDPCGDGIDQDCDGQDLQCQDDGDWDNDGYKVVDGDCNDYDATIYPDAQEICGDGIDQDCNGEDKPCQPDDIDNDGDGFTENQGDCDDTKDWIYPGATEICGNGIDEDCYEQDRECGTQKFCGTISDIPLSTAVQAAPSSIMFVLDDSGSMDWEFMTDEGDGLFDGRRYVFDNPGDNLYSGVLPDSDRNRWKSQWSGYNKMYYNPNVEYEPWPTLGDADRDNPRSHPMHSGTTFNLNGTYNTLYVGGTNSQVVLIRDTDGSSTCADAVRFVMGGTEIIIDNEDSGFSTTGSWNESSGASGYDPSIPGPAVSGDRESLYSSNTGSRAIWSPNIATAGNYEVFAWWTIAGTRDPSAPYAVTHDTGTDTVYMDQQANAGQWNSLGTYYFDVSVAGSTKNVKRAHYYRWHDLNDDGVQDNGEVFLVELDGTGSTGNIRYYPFNDLDADDRVDAGELGAELTQAAAQAAGTWPRKENGDFRTYAEERQNFANWYQYYRKRELAATAAVSKVIYDMSGVRIGILTINHLLTEPLVSIKVDGETDQTSYLLGKLYDMVLVSNGTPLRRGLEDVGQYFHDGDSNAGNLAASTNASDAPWDDADDGGACQQAFAIVMTDGYYNGGSPSVDNADGDGNTLYDGSPYGDAFNNTLADVAMYYYENDLSGLPDVVPPNAMDSAKHQHMVTYTVSFGVFGTLPGDHANCPSQCPWPDPTTNNQHKIDDLFHAAVNGRGEYLSAENPKELVDSLTQLRMDIEQRIGSGASVTINSQELYDGSVLYKGIYDTNNWTGDLQAYELYTVQDEIDEAERAELAGEDPDPNIRAGMLKNPYKWSAREALENKASTDRIIVSYDKTQTFGFRGISFRYSDKTDPEKTRLKNLLLTQAERDTLDNAGEDALAEDIIQYLRGDSTNEQANGGSFRSREAKLGDIVHCAPYQYGDVIFVGANDGMLHAFKESDGSELFSYIPELVFENLRNLTTSNPTFTHKFFVDKTPYAVSVPSLSKTLLIGGLGKGGRGYYCLDITDVSASGSKPGDEGVAAGIPLWEYPSTADNDGLDNDGVSGIDDPAETWAAGKTDPDMGYSFSRAFIVKSNDVTHPWVVIFGNGYESENGRAVLYILDPANGDMIKKIDTGVGDPVTQCNGLSTPSLVDKDLNGTVDYIYAGDLLGNLWKFDMTGTSASDWKIAFNTASDYSGTPMPMFTAGFDDGIVHTSPATVQPTVQPITIKPEVITHCNSRIPGYIVLFGTGRYLGTEDIDDNTVQTMYGIWDWSEAWEQAGESAPDKYMGTLAADKSLTNLVANLGLSHVNLVQQTQIRFLNDFRFISDNHVNYYSPDSGEGDHVGWFFELPSSGERVIHDMIVRSGVLIAISSIPSTSPCAAGGASFIHELNACSGGALLLPQFDINDDGKIDDKDRINIGSIDDPDKEPPQGKKHLDWLFPPGVLRIEDDNIPEPYDKKYFSSSRGEVKTVDEKAENIGAFFWKELN